MGAGMTSIDQRISHCKLHAAIRAGLGVGPGLAVAVSRPHVNLGKLGLKVLELRRLLHCLSVK